MDVERLERGEGGLAMLHGVGVVMKVLPPTATPVRPSVYSLGVVAVFPGRCHRDVVECASAFPVTPAHTRSPWVLFSIVSESNDFVVLFCVCLCVCVDQSDTIHSPPPSPPPHTTLLFECCGCCCFNPHLRFAIKKLYNHGLWGWQLLGTVHCNVSQDVSFRLVT